jgi:hypothetical protein
LKAFRLALARKMFELGLWKLGRYVLRDGDVMFLDAGATLSSAMKAASRPPQWDTGLSERCMHPLAN